MNASLRSVREELESLRRAGLGRTLRTVETLPGAAARADGRQVLVLCSNDYLGLATDPRLAAATASAAAGEGAGGGSARLVTGTRPCHVALEDDVRAFTGAEAALTLSSGFLANLSVLGALLGREDVVVSDERNHASLVDGIRLSGAERRIVPHRDVAAARVALRDRSRFRRAAIVTEGLFSMDGDVAPLADLADLAGARDAFLVVDDAHGTGVLGATGGGVLEAEGVGALPEVVRVGTFGKAFGAAGAFVAGPREVVDLVVHRGRGFVYSTAAPPPAVAAAREGLRIAREEPLRRAACLARAHRLRGALRERGVRVPEGVGPIVPVLVGDPDRAVEMSRRLLAEHGLLVIAIRPPTVPHGTSRLRLSATAMLAEAELERAAAALAQVLS
jgi:8-amino-7-oxononanoate synthase